MPAADVDTPIHAFFQPVRNVPMLASIGVNVFWGPEVEGRSTMAPAAIAAKEAEWVEAVRRAGCTCVLKRPTGPLPPHCVGVLLNADEPNGKGIPAASLQPEADVLRATFPGTPIYLSLAGDKITSANLKKPHEWEALAAYLALADVVSVNAYSKNRNATRYPVTWTADAVKTVKAVSPRTAVVAWVEVNDQQLPAPKPGEGENREPTPQEIRGTVTAAIIQGADGVGWFATCDSGKYGWPGSYWPLVNRKGEPMLAQYDALRQIARDLNGEPEPGEPAPPTPKPDDAATNVTRAELRDALAPIRDTIDGYQQVVDKLRAELNVRAGEVLALRGQLAQVGQVLSQLAPINPASPAPAAGPA